MTDNVTRLATANERWVQEQEHELWPAIKFTNHKNCRVCGPGPLKRGMIPSAFDHVCYKVVLTKGHDSYGYAWTSEEEKPCGPSDATVISSQIEGSKFHSVMLDIDIPSRLIESSTPGHHHLYIDHKLTWRQYRKLLKALLHAGLIEPGFYKASVKRKATNLRPPWLDKETT